MKDRVHYSTPMFHVADVEKSVAFYQLLGMQLAGTHKFKDRLVWASMICKPAEGSDSKSSSNSHVFFTQADGKVDSKVQAALLYLYSLDLAGLRERLVKAGIRCSEIEKRFYMEGGEMRVEDPDGYVLLIGQDR